MNRKIKTEFSRMIQIPTWGRGEKSEVLTKEMENMSQILQTMQDICHTLSKGIREGIPNYPGEPDKRTKKTPEWVLAQTLRKCSEDLAGFYNTALGTMLTSAAETEEILAKSQIQYEVQVEESLFKPLADLENDYKNVGKLKKQLQKLSIDTENAKKKYQSAARQSALPSETSSVKLAQMRDEYEELSKQLEHSKDLLTTEILSMMSREGDCSDVVLNHVKLKADYHRQALRLFDSVLPQMEDANEQLQRPLFGADLQAELKRNRRKIASVIEICTTFLHQNSLEEEGLFRLTGSASRVKMFKAAFDAQVENESSHQYEVVDLMNYHSDHHAVASTLKSYLRELHEPLTTTALYDDWMEAVKVGDQTLRCRALAAVINKLPEQNYDNLGYLIKFLSAVASRSDKNKMTASNLAIVIAPNLFSNADNDKTLYDAIAANLQNALVEILITNQKDFFPGDFEPSGDCGAVRNCTPKDSSTLDLSGGSESGGSPRPVTPPDNIAPPPSSPKLAKLPLKAKRAPAPPPLPKRTENILPPSTENSSLARVSPPASRAEPVTHLQSNLYPDVSKLVAASLVTFGPTILPVPFNPPSPAAVPRPPDSPESVPRRMTNSPSPAPRTRVKGPAVPPKEFLLQNNSETSRAAVNGHGHDLDGKPDRPPPPPPRQDSENTTYL